MKAGIVSNTNFEGRWSSKFRGIMRKLKSEITSPNREPINAIIEELLIDDLEEGLIKGGIKREKLPEREQLRKIIGDLFSKKQE